MQILIIVVIIVFILYRIGKKEEKKEQESKSQTSNGKTSTTASKPNSTASKPNSTTKKPTNRWAGKVSHATPHLDEMPTDGTWDDAFDYIQYLLTINNSLPAGAKTKAAKNDFKLKGFAQYLSQMVTKLWDDARLIDFGDNDKVVEVKFYVAADAVLQLLGTRNGTWFVNALHFSSFRDEYDKIAAAHPELPMGPSFARLSSKAEVAWLGELIAAEANDVPSLEYVEYLTYNIDAGKCGQLEAVKAEKARKAAQAEAERKSAPKKPSGSAGGTPKKSSDGSNGGGTKKPASDLEAQMQAMLKGGSGTGAEPKPPEKPAEPPKPKKPAGPSKAQIDGLMKRIIDYYTEMWNPKTGSLYKELDVSMPIDHFSIQLKADRLVDSVWLSGDELPLVSETAYTDLPGSSELTRLPRSITASALQSTLTGLGTVTYDEQNDLYYPIHKKKPQEPPKDKPDSSGKPANDLAAQMQAILDKDKKK